MNLSLLLLCLAPLSHAASTSLTPRQLDSLLERPVLKEHHPAPRGWRAIRPPPPDYKLQMNFGLRQQNVDLLTEKLLAMSDPLSPSYGSHLSQSSLSALLAPTDLTTTLVHAWLRSHGIDPLSSNTAHESANDWITVTLPVSKVEQMLGTDYYVWRHEVTGVEIVRTEKWGLPSVLADHVDVVQPTNKFITPTPLRAPLQLLQPLHFSPVLPTHLDASLKSTIDPLAKALVDPALIKAAPILVPDTDGNIHALPVTGDKEGDIIVANVNDATSTTTGVVPKPNGLADTVAGNGTAPGSLADSSFGALGSSPLGGLNEAINLVAAKKQAPKTASCNSVMTVGCLRDLYNMTPYSPSITKRTSSKLAIASFLDQYATYTDTSLFLASQRKEAYNATKGKFRWYPIAGGKNPQDQTKAGSEASLDMQYGIGLAWPVETEMYSTKGRMEEFIPDAAEPENGNEPYQTAVNYWLAMNDSSLPKVISTSYGDDEQTVPPSYAARVCTSFAQLGARGVSMLFASGDGGVGGLAGDDHELCISNDGKETYQFLPTFPASCPWITSVGATVGVQEKATTRYASGAGFSNYFKQPSYQKKVVEAYKKNVGDIYPGLWNKTGRASPDVSASGDNFMIYVGGSPMLIGGTSASTPVFAAIVALLNDYRLSRGGKPLGFLNPWLYTNGTSFLKDVTQGSSFGCGTKGFAAAKGWDPVTGMGTPNMGRMLKRMPKS